MFKQLKILLWALLLTGAGAANAAPTINLGEANNYCVTYCYIRVPFTIADYGATNKIGRVFCDFDADVTASLPVYGGEARTKNMQATSIGVFKADKETVKGDVEMNTGITNRYFVGAKLKSVHCHL